MTFEESFAQLRKERGFKATLEELDEIYFILDYVQKEGFVSNQLGRMICRRISETLGMWINYLHNLVMPAPNNMVNMTESQFFDDKEKDDIMKLMTKIMAHMSKNNAIGITKDTARETEFIDESISLWNELKPQFAQISKKIEQEWEKKVKE